jgi:hypothetical protein|tara:strand:+ start:99 stop:482 length:384 start_codon:yes stop_codon:yes gene_type:complete
VPATVFRTSAWFGLQERYFRNGHVIAEPASSQETEEIRQAVEATLQNYSVNTTSVAMTFNGVSGSAVTDVLWRVDVSYIGDFIPAEQVDSFTASLDANVRAAPLSAHSNSAWSQSEPLTVLHVVGIH